MLLLAAPIKMSGSNKSARNIETGDNNLYQTINIDINCADEYP